MIQGLINGIILGGEYVIFAIGWTVLLGAARVVNFAHGQLIMVGALTTWAAWNAGLPYALAIAVGIVIAGAVGAIMQFAMLRMTFDLDLSTIMIVTLGFGYVLQGSAALLFGSSAKQVQSPLDSAQFRLGGTFFSAQDIVIVVIALALLAAVWVVLTRTKLGRVVSAVAENPRLAQAYGINAARVYVGLFAFAAAAAALAGGLIVANAPVLPSLGFDQLIITFVVVVVGGIGNIVGTFYAAFGLGLFHAYFGAFVSPAYATAASFAVVLIILAVRPEGLVRRHA